MGMWTECFSFLYEAGGMLFISLYKADGSSVRYETGELPLERQGGCPRVYVR